MKIPPGISPFYLRRAVLWGAIIFDDLLIGGLLLWQQRNFGFCIVFNSLLVESVGSVFRSDNRWV
jgi:hypothetical protein